MNTALHPALARAYQADVIRNAPRRRPLRGLKARRAEPEKVVSPASRRTLLLPGDVTR